VRDAAQNNSAVSKQAAAQLASCAHNNKHACHAQFPMVVPPVTVTVDALVGHGTPAVTSMLQGEGGPAVAVIGGIACTTA
jgi:hypothetical protein